MPAPSRTPVALKRKRTEQLRGKTAKRPKKFIKRQSAYHSSSEDESGDEQPQKAADTYESASSEDEANDAPDAAADDDEFSDAELEDAAEEASDDEGSHSDNDEYDDDDSDVASSTALGRAKKKRNDPEAFATSLQKILGSKLSTTKRADPILSRSKVAQDAGKEFAESKLEAKARHKLRDEKHALLEKGRVKDVLGVDTPEVSTQHIQEEERRLKKTAQRGVVKLFNAVRAAQVKGEQAAKEAKMKGVVGMDKRDEKVSEMSKKGFLDLIAGGGKKTAAA